MGRSQPGTEQVVSVDDIPVPYQVDDADALIAAAKSLEPEELTALVARIVIDSLGRPWNPILHPRDAHGRFIETFAEIRGLFKTSGGGRGAPKISGRVVAFDHNGDVWVRVDHVADGYTGHKPGDLVPIKPDDIEAQAKLATIPKALDDGQRSEIEALAARMEGRNPDAAAALRRAADPANTEPIAQLADLHEARDALDADGSPDAVAVRDAVWDLSDQLGDHPSNDEVLKAAQAMVRDHLAQNPTQNAEAIARLDRDIHAEAPAGQPSAPDAAQALAGQLYKVADRIQDVNPADAVHVRNVAAKLGEVGLTGETPERRDARLEAAATQALKINNANLKKKIVADIKHMRQNPPQEAAPAPERADNVPKARLEPPAPAAPLPAEPSPAPAAPDAQDPVEWARGVAKQGGGIKPHENPADATPEELRVRQAKVEAEIEALQKKAFAHPNALPLDAQAQRLDALVKEHDAIEARLAEPAPETPPVTPAPEVPAEPVAEVPAPPSTPPTDTPVSAAPDEYSPDDELELPDENVEAITPAVPAQLAPLGDLGAGIQWEDMPHGLVLRGNVFPHKDEAKAAGFRWADVPGEQKRDGAPLKAWTAIGTPEKRQEMLAKLADRLGLPDPLAAGDVEEEYPPTEQQQAIIDAVNTGQDVAVRALAGTGKTSTLKMIARRLFKSDPNKRIVYVAFNKSIQEEAQKTMPPNVEARTGDSIAFATLSPGMKDKFADKAKRALRRNADVAAFLGIKGDLDMGPGVKPMAPDEQAMRVMRAIEQYAISADDKLGVEHFQGMDPDTASKLLPYAEKAWEDINAEDGRLKLNFSHITKMWALSKPDFTKTTSGLKRKADIIFFDEAQDINPVMAKVIADQKIQKVYVGDSNQAIYAFRGAVDELDNVKVDHDLPLTKSWRFGPQIASMGNRFLAMLGSKHRIEGGGPEGNVVEPYTMTDPDAILVRSNAGAIGEILQAQTEGKVVGVPKGTKADLRKLVDTARWLQRGGPAPAQIHDDLAAFRNWDEVQKAAEAGDDPKVAMLAKIVEDTGIDKLNDLVERLVETGDNKDNRTPDMYVTTAHKAKGLEWDKVKIGADFRGPRLDKQTGELIMPSPEEMRLAYVAVTRAMKELDPGSLAWVYDYTDENGETRSPESPSPSPEPPADSPSSPSHWTEPGTPETGPDTTPPAPEARVPSGPQHPGPTLLGQIIQAARDGGFTFDPRSKNFKTEGFAVARQGYGEHFSVDDPDVEAKIDAYIDQHWDTFANDEGAYLGGWVNEGEIWLDVPDVLDSREDAIAEGTKRFEIAIADLAAYANGDDGEIRLQYAERPPRGTPAHNDWTDLEGVRHVEPESAADSAPSGAGRDEGPVQAPGEAGPGPDAAGDVGAVPDGWVENTDPFNGEPDGSWTKGDYTAFAGTIDNPDGLRVVEFGEGYAVLWKVDAANWSEVEAKVAEHEALKDNGGLAQEERGKLAADADRLGLGPDLIDAIKSGTPDQIRAALDQDEHYAELRRAFQNAMAEGADQWDGPQERAIADWFDINGNLLLKLREADLLTGTDQPALSPQEAPDARVPAAPEVPTAPEVPAYSGELRPIQPRDLGEMLNAVDNAQEWMESFYENQYIRPGNDGDQKAYNNLIDAVGRLRNGINGGDYDGAQRALDDFRNEIEAPGVAPEFKNDMSEYVNQIQGVLDKVNQRDKGQFEIPGVAQPSVAPFAEHANPEGNAAFDDMVQHDPDVARDVKDLNAALLNLERAIQEGGDEGGLADLVRGIRDSLNNRDYQAVVDQLPGIVNQQGFGTPSDPYATPDPRYSNYFEHGVVEAEARKFMSDWGDMLAANAPEQPATPDVPASQEPLQSWEKALLDGFDKPEVMTPDMVDAANEVAQKQEMWRNIVAQMDGELGGTYMGDVYNAVIQDQNITKPDQIEAVVARQRSKYVAEGDQPAVDIIDRIIRENQPGPQSNVPGPYNPAANPEAVMPDAPGDGSPIKDENRVIDARVRGEIEDVKRGVGLPELPDRLDYDRNGVAVFALDLVDVPAAGKQGKGDRRRPPGIGQVRRIYVKNGVTYAEVWFYDPAFVDYPNRNRVKAEAGLNNGIPFYPWDGIRLDKIQKVDGANPDAVEFLGHLGPEEARQYAGRNAGRLAQNRGRVRPELERMANLQYIGDRYVPDANGLPIAKGDIVLYNGKKYEIARVNVPEKNPENVRLDLVPVGADGELELQAGGKHAEPYARMVQFYDQPLGDRKPAVTVDELKDFVRRLDADKKYAVGQAVHDALDGGDLKEIARAFNEDPAILTYVADGRAYINDYIGRLLNANLRGNFDAINQHEQEMVRKDKNDLLNAIAAMDGRFLEGTGADRHIRRAIPDAGPDREYKGKQPEVLMPLRYVQVKEAVAKERAAHPEDDGLWATVQDAIARAGALNLDDEDNYWAAMREFEAIRQSANAGLGAPELGNALDALQRAMDAWHQDQEKRRAIRQGGPGAEAQLPAGRTIAPGLVRPPAVPSNRPVPAPQSDADRAYADKLGNDPMARFRYMNMRNDLQAMADAADDMPELRDYLDEANRALINGNYGEGYHAIENVLGIPADHPNAGQLARFQDRLAQDDNYVRLGERLRAIQQNDWPNNFFPDTVEINAGKAPAAPAAPATPNTPHGQYDEPDIRQAFYDLAKDLLDRGVQHDEPGVRDALEKYRVGGIDSLNDDERLALHNFVGQVDYNDVRNDTEMQRLWPHPGPFDGMFLDQFYSALDKPAPAGKAAPVAPAAPNALVDKAAGDLQVGDIWVVENASDLGGPHPGVGEWRIQAVDEGDTANRYRVERVGGKGAFGDNADVYLRHGVNVRVRGDAAAPAEPAAPAVPQKPAVDMPDHMREHIKNRIDRVMPQGAKDAADALNAGMAPNAPDLEALHDAVDKGIARGNNATEYQEIKDWLDTYAPRAGAAPATPDSPVAPSREPADVRKAIADAVEAKYEELRADRKNNEARKKALAVQDAGDAIDAALDRAIAYHGGDGADDVDTRDTAMRDARVAIEDDIRPVDPALADQLDDMLAEIEKRFARDDDERLVQRYMDEAQKFHDADTPDNDQRDRMLRAARDQAARVGRADSARGAELEAQIKSLEDQFAADDIERARAKPVGRTEAIDNFDAEIAAERKRLRDAGQKAEARALDAKAEAVAEALNDAEDAHKSGDKDARDAAIARARAAAEELDSTSPDLAEIARRAVEGNAARFARADAGPVFDGTIEVEPGKARTDINIPAPAGENTVEAAAHAFLGMSQSDIHEMARGRMQAPAGYSVENLDGGCVGGAKKITHLASKKKFVIKSDNISPLGLEAEEDMSTLYRALGFAQPKVYRLRAQNDGQDIIMMDWAGQEQKLTHVALYGKKWPGGFFDYRTPELDELGLSDPNDAIRYALANAITGQTDRHPGNIYWGQDKAGNGVAIFIDNGLALFNGGHRPSYDTTERNNSKTPWIYNPMEILFRTNEARDVTWNVNSNLQAAVQQAGLAGRAQVRETISEWAERMRREALQREQEFRNTATAELIARRAGWVLDNLDDVVDALVTGTYDGITWNGR